ncbi:MAG: alpha/beta hydrolase, partial [Epsilonproteobacteria bacterium]|nr:alpha/beta hydrolase [Campylobacterota bacterium]
MKWVLATLLMAALYPVFVVYRQSLGHKTEILKSPAEWGAAYEDITYRTADGLTLRGWWIPGRDERAVLLLHG